MQRLSEPEMPDTQALMKSIQEHYGYDLSDFQTDFIEEQLRSALGAGRFSCPEKFSERLLEDEIFFQKFLARLSPKKSSLFEDPVFFSAVRSHVLPLLRTYPSLKIWQVGADPGDIYSLAILLKEHGVYERCRIYTTDISTQSLSSAEEGYLTKKSFKASESHYRQLGGRSTLLEYFEIKNGKIQVAPALKRNLVFFQYNPSTDSSPNEFHLILCRGLLNEFQPKMKKRVLELFHASLCSLGVLGLDKATSISENDRFSPLVTEVGLFQKRG